MTSQRSNKIHRSLNAFKNESLKRIPYIGMVLAAILIYQFVQLNLQTAESVQSARRAALTAKEAADSSKRLLQRVATLSQDNKDINTQNKLLAERSNRQLDCVAQLFAKYTRDGLPIVIEDLNDCSATSLSSMNTPIIPTPVPSSAPAEQPDPVTPPAQEEVKKKDPPTREPPSPITGIPLIDDILRLL